MHKIENKFRNYEFIRETKKGSVIFDTENYNIEIYSDRIDEATEEYYSYEHKGNQIIIFNSRIYVDKEPIGMGISSDKITINYTHFEGFDIVLECENNVCVLLEIRRKVGD